MGDESRRDVVRGAGAVLTGTVLAGCNGDSGDPPGDDSTWTPQKEETTYELEIAATDEIDLTGVYDLLLDEYASDEIAGFTEEEWQNAWKTVLGTQGIRDEDHARIEYTLTEYLDGEENGETEPDHLELGLENRDGEQIYSRELGPDLDDAYSLACTELTEGRNDLTVTAEIDGKPFEQNTTIRKIAPDRRLIEAYADGEKVTEYWSPWSFDTWHTDREEFHEQNYRQIRDLAWDSNHLQSDGDDPLDYVDEQEMQDMVEQEDWNGLLEYTFLKMGDFTAENGIISDSTTAQIQAATQKYMITETTSLEPGDIQSAGFDNPGEPGENAGGHGTKAFHIKGDWYHQETVAGGETLHVDNIEYATMRGARYISVMRDIDREMGRLDEERKIKQLNSFFIGLIDPVDINRYDFLMNGEKVYESIEKVRDNVDWDEFMLDTEVSADMYFETGRHNILAGTTEKPLIISSAYDILNDDVYDYPEVYTTERLIEELDS